MLETALCLSTETLNTIFLITQSNMKTSLQDMLYVLCKLMEKMCNNVGIGQKHVFSASLICVVLKPSHTDIIVHP